MGREEDRSETSTVWRVRVRELFDPGGVGTRLSLTSGSNVLLVCVF